MKSKSAWRLSSGRAARARLDHGRSVGVISLDTFRVGAVEQWQRYLNESYAQILAAGPVAAPAPVSPAAAPGTAAGAPTAAGTAAPPALPPAAPPPALPGATIAATFHPAAQTRVNTSRLQELIGRLQVDYANLGAQKSGFAFLLDETSVPGRTKLANGTVLVSGLLTDVGAYADLQPVAQARRQRLRLAGLAVEQPYAARASLRHRKGDRELVGVKAEGADQSDHEQ